MAEKPPKTHWAELRQIVHLFLGKSTKTAATRAALFDSNMHQTPLGELTTLPQTRAFQFGQKKFRFSSVRFSLPNRFFRFDSIRQSDKFAACTLIFK